METNHWPRTNRTRNKAND